MIIQKPPYAVQGGLNVAVGRPPCEVLELYIIMLSESTGNSLTLKEILLMN